MQPVDTSYVLPLIASVAAAAAVAPERWFKRLFVAGTVGVPLIGSIAIVASTVATEGVSQGILVMVAATMMIFGFWCLPVLVGFGLGFALRFAFQSVKSRLRG